MSRLLEAIGNARVPLRVGFYVGRPLWGIKSAISTFWRQLFI